MRKTVWEKALKTAADPERARSYFESLRPLAPAALDHATEETAQVLTALWSGSQALSELLLTHPDWISEVLLTGQLQHPRQKQGLRREINQWLAPALEKGDFEGAFRKLRLFKQRELLRIAARDLARLGSALQITEELSNAADACLDAVHQLCRAQLIERRGMPFHQDPDGQWQPTEFSVIGLGKLGGQELNYSSDVDVIFVYTEEGCVFQERPRPGAKTDRAMTSHQYFRRLAEAIIAEVTRSTAEGVLYRIDLRLRPEGEAGPLVRSLSSYESYYAQWGQTWERMMLIKARGVAGASGLAGEFLETIQPFRYPRSLGEGVLREITGVKERIETEIVRSGELDRNVKLGRGGIREIEFITQALQVLHAGRIPFLQGAQTLPVLEKLVAYELLDRPEAKALSEAYWFLRDVEHRLQMESNLQTHSIPANRAARERLARVMGFPKLTEFDRALALHTGAVRQIYERLFRSEPEGAPSALPKHFKGAERTWQELLKAHCFRDPEQACRLINEFVNGPGYGHVSQRTMDLAFQLLPRFLALCPKQDGSRLPTPEIESGPRSPGQGIRLLSDPDRVVARLDSFITKYGARAMLFETWASHPTLFDLLLLLFDRSEFLAETAIRTPDLVEELVVSGRLRRQKSAAEILEDLRHGLNDPDQFLWLRRYHEAEFMRIGLRDILGLADAEQHLSELSALADACLQYALETVLRKHRIRKTPLAIIGLGKLGGQELTYGSDLDIILVADCPPQDLPRLQKLAIEVMELLSKQTEHGSVFPTDARLRPDGEKGLLVNTLAAYEEYYRRRALLWEIQSLSRSRPVAGDPVLGGRFQNLAAAVANFHPAQVAAGFPVRIQTETQTQRTPPVRSRPRKTDLTRASSGLAAYQPDWKREIARMRRRIEKERTPAGQDSLAIKTGAGGLIDAEFIAQTLSLEHGWQEANTLRALHRAQAEGVLPGAEQLMENYGKLRRIEGILRRWSFEGETVLPTEPAPFYRVSVRCGFASPEAFRTAIAAYRASIRSVYESVSEGVERDRTATEAKLFGGWMSTVSRFKALLGGAGEEGWWVGWDSNPGPTA